MSDMVSTGMTARDAKEKLTGLLRTIRKLLDKAEGTDNVHEASAFRAHAQKLMDQYHIDEEALIAAAPESIMPERSTIDLCGWHSRDFVNQYSGLFHAIARHTGIRTKVSWVAAAEGGWKLIGDSVGYEADLRYAEMLFTEARIVFQEKLEPAVKQELTVAENVYRLRSSGMTRQAIAEAIFGEWSPQNGIKVGNIYKAECARRGEDPVVSGRNINAKLYRETYAKRFVERFATRLRQARDGADGTGGAIQLHGRSERVDEAFYSSFPEYRPATTPFEPEEPCKACKRAKGGKCRSHRPAAWTKADQERWERQNYSASALGGQAAGKAAADAVQLERVNGAKRLGEDETRKTMRDLTGLEIQEK